MEPILEVRDESSVTEQVVFVLLTVRKVLVALVRLALVAQVFPPEEPILRVHCFLFCRKALLHKRSKGP